MSTTTNFAVGDTLTNLGEIDKAIKHFKHCQQLLSDHFSCFLGLANLYNLLGDQKRYVFYLQKSAALIAENNLYQTSRLDVFEQHIKNLSLQNPNSLDLNLLLGLASYYQSNCQLAITQYEKARKEKGSEQIEVWDFAEGISHELNLAYCYQQRNNHAAAQQVLDSYYQFIQQLPKSKHTMPGRTYSQARYLALMGQTDKVKTELKKIDSWSYIWLVDYDPILKSLIFDRK